MSTNAKVLRSQLRQIVKEMFPELIATELYQNLQKQNREGLELIQKLVKESLERMDSRQKDVQAMVLRELTSSPKPSDQS